MSVVLSLPIVRLFKVSIEEIGLFLSPIFNLAKFNIGDYRVKIGWLPLSGYIKVKELVLNDGDLISDNSFALLKPWQKLSIYFLMPLSVLVFLAILKISNGDGFWPVVPIMLLLGLINALKYLDVKNHNQANTIYTEQYLRMPQYLLSLVVYLGFLVAFILSLYVAYFHDFSTNLHLNNYLLMSSSGSVSTLYRYILLIGLFSVTINMLPLSATSGAKTVDLFYESFTKSNIPSDCQDKIATYGLPIILIAWVWFLKLLIFDFT